MERRVLKHSRPAIIVEVRKVVGGSRNRGEPIVEFDVKLWSDITGLRVENERDRTGVFVGESKIDVPVERGVQRGSFFPSEIILSRT